MGCGGGCGWGEEGGEGGVGVVSLVIDQGQQSEGQAGICLLRAGPLAKHIALSTHGLLTASLSEAVFLVVQFRGSVLSY